MLQFLLTVGQLCAALAAIGVVVSTVYLAVKRPWKFARMTLASFQRTQNTVEMILTELGPNGGKSLGAAVHRQGEELQIQTIAILRTAAKVDAVTNLIEMPVFQTDELGHFVSVNQALCMTFGYPAAELLGLGFVSALDDADRESFMNSWNYAIRDRRAFRRQTKIRTRDDAALVVMWSAQPTTASAIAGVIGWIGSIEIVQVVR